MIRCPTCTGEVAEASRFCSTCGAALSADPSTTVTSVPSATPTPAPTSSDRRGVGGTMDTRGVGRVTSGSSAGGERFVPGEMVGGRYRIIGLLGKGGMGEVYRADDLTLDQPVALKFLPRALETDEGRLRRFLNEARTARQVSHPNVCRVYDIGEVDGRHFLSMEFVDGEDLATLLRRIGRVSGDKALQIGRQICAGLAAAHAKGIVHRDLKPANIMLDGDGQVRITDFGLAGLADAFQGAEVRVGTPAYMAPEQIAGEGVSARSDIYSLGLVLYELFTGTPTFEAATLNELTRKQRETAPTRPSTHVSDLDPAVERVILRCLEKDPAGRPSTALAVAAALPGGDPLAAALAAGETPSPEMVAEAGDSEGLRPTLAVGGVAWVIAGLLAILAMTSPAALVRQLPMERSTDALVDASRGLLAGVGLTDPPGDRWRDWTVDTSYFEWVERSDESPRRWDGLASVRPGPLQFRYRESPRPLVDDALASDTTWSNPPLTVSGMANVRLDSEGRLITLSVVPPQREAVADDPVAADWDPLFEAAGLDRAAFREVVPEWNPLVDCDVRAAWEGEAPGQPGVTLRVEAGSWQGRPVWFAVVPPWAEPFRMQPVTRDARAMAYGVVGVTLLVLLIVGAILLARRNLKLGRGDRRGAFRMAAYLFLVLMAAWTMTAHHQLGFAEIGLFFSAVGESLFMAGLVWIVYVALEPSVRRLWPHALISWTRLVAGRWRDPLVGRDVLVGCATGVLIGVIVGVTTLLPGLLGRPEARPIVGNPEALVSVRQALADVFVLQSGALILPISFLFLLLLLRVVLRTPWLATTSAFAIMTGLAILQNADRPIDWIALAMLWGLVILVIVRLGVLAALVSVATGNLMWRAPLTTDASAWMAGRGWTVLALIVALALAAAAIAMAGRRLFAGTVLDE